MIKQYENVVSDEATVWMKQHFAKFDKNSSSTVGFIEVPFDMAVSYRPGTRFGPSKIMEILANQSLYCVDKRVSLDKLNMKILGAVEMVNSLNKSYANIRKMIRKALNNYVPVVIGGDHSITDPILREVIRKYTNNIGLIVFDAHFDSRVPIAGKEHSGHWLYTLHDVINYQNVVQIGVSASIYSKIYMDNAEHNGVCVITPYDMRKLSPNALLNKINEQLKNCTGIYISVDIDVIDQAFAPGTSVPNACGLYPYEVADTIYELSKFYKVIGFDLTEVSPPLDINNATSRVATQIVINLLAGISEKNKNK